MPARIVKAEKLTCPRFRNKFISHIKIQKALDLTILVAGDVGS